MRGWKTTLTLAGLAWAGVVVAEDVMVARERLAELEARARRVEELEVKVRALEAEVAGLKGGRDGALGVSGPPAMNGVGGGVRAGSWLPGTVARSVERAGPAPAVATRAAEGSMVPMAHVLEHFAADGKAALARYGGVRLRFTGVVSDVEKPLFMAPYDVFFRRAETPLRVRVRLMPPSAASRVYVTQDRTEVVGEWGGRREVLARVGDAVEFEGMVKGMEGGWVEVKATGGLKGARE